MAGIYRWRIILADTDFQQSVSASVIGRLLIFFHDQTIFLKDYELYIIGHSLSAYVSCIQFLFFQIRTLGGELVRIVRQENNVKFLTNSSEANLRASNIETAFGLVQVIDSVLI